MENTKKKTVQVDGGIRKLCHFQFDERPANNDVESISNVHNVRDNQKLSWNMIHQKLCEQHSFGATTSKSWLVSSPNVAFFFLL